MAEVVGHAAHPAFAEAAKSGKFGVKAQALGVEAHQEVVFRQLGHGSQGGGADYAVIGHGGGALQIRAALPLPWFTAASKNCQLTASGSSSHW